MPKKPLDQLAALADKRRKDDLELEKRVFQLVWDARGDGASWAAIGDALGMSRQAAWERFESWRIAPDSPTS